MSRDRRSVVSHCENRVAERGNPDSRFLDRLDCAVTGRNSPLMPEFDPSGGIQRGAVSFPMSRQESKPIGDWNVIRLGPIAFTRACDHSEKA